LQIEPEQSSAASAFLPITGVEKDRAAGLVNRANRLWASLSAQNLKMIARFFREAIDLDPDNAEAFAGLSYSLLAGGILGYLRIPAAYASAKEAAVRALAIDPTLPEARCAEAWLKMVYDRNWQEARQGFNSILNQLQPSTPAMIGSALLHLAEGAPQRAVNQLRETFWQYAMNAPAMALYCWSNYLAGDYAEALNLAEELRSAGLSGPVLDAVEALACIQCETQDAFIPRIEALAADASNYQLVYGVLGYAYAISGNTLKASEVLDAISQSERDRGSVVPYAIALILIGLGEKQDSVRWLEQSYRNGSLWSLGYSADPILQALRDEPGYRTMMNRISYPVQ
jgi:tetratricopeptide (TPR) repeat protein